MAITDIEDRRAQLDAFAAQPMRENNLPAPTAVFSAPAERVFGAQQVAVRRDEAQILGKLRTLAAAAGESWYYRYPVRKKVKDEQTGKETWVTDYIEGPSIKLANDLARLYGNLDVDVRIFDLGDAWVMYARLMDLETGFSMTRPFQQRKGQKAMKTDDARALDIALQIGVSKAIRNVVVNGLQTFADFAFEEARNALVEKVGKRLDEYRTRLLQRLSEMNIAPKRAELVVGRSSADWLAPDVARLIAMLKSVQEGMATAEEAFPPIESLQGSESSDQRAADENPEPAARSDSRSGPEGGSEAASKRHASEPSESGGAPSTTTAGAKQAIDQADQSRTAGAAPATGAKPAAGGANDPRAEGEYVAHAMAWINACTDAAAGEKRWKDEKQLRNHCNVAPEVRDKLIATLNEKIAELKKNGESAELEKHDQALATAAKSGSKALDEAIAKVPEPHRTTLKVAIERRHRPAAAAADASSAGGQQ